MVVVKKQDDLKNIKRVLLSNLNTLQPSTQTLLQKYRDSTIQSRGARGACMIESDAHLLGLFFTDLQGLNPLLVLLWRCDCTMHEDEGSKKGCD
jgi:hypothetical protein